MPTIWLSVNFDFLISRPQRNGIQLVHLSGELTRGAQNLEMAAWFEGFLTATDEGEEFTVTAEQAKWIIANAQETFESYELEDGEEADSSNLELIIETFDDYANFVRLGQSDNGLADIFRTVNKDDKLD
jgi:hypothetical protein